MAAATRPGVDVAAVRPRALAGRRATAALVDVLLVAGLTIALALGLDRLAGRGEARAGSGSVLLDAAALLALAAVPVSWFVVGEAWFRATPGKWLLRLQVTRRSGPAIGFRRAACRLLYRSAFLGVLAAVGLLRRQGPWHDRWTDTEVRRRDRPPTAPAPAPADAEEPAHGAEAGAEEPPHGDEARSAPDPASAPLTDQSPGIVAEPTREPTPEAPAPAVPEATTCRCGELRQLSGEEAAAYARGHLLSVRRWPEAGRFELVCPTTRLTWVARDGWATEQGETILMRRDADGDRDRVAAPQR